MTPFLKRLALLATLFAAPAHAQNGVRIDQLPPVSGPLTGAETLPILVGSTLKSATMAQLTSITTLKWQGAWSSSTAYAINDAVSLAGSSYVAVAASTNQTPPNATYWALLASVGAAGSNGSGAGTVTSIICGAGLSGGTITVSGTCSITAPVTVALGGTNATSASGTALDNISGFSGTGFLLRSGAGAYGFVATPLPVTSGGTGATTAGATSANNVGALAIASNLSDVSNVTTVRSNLGLGALALLSNLSYANINSTALATSAQWLANTASVLNTPNAVWGGASPYALTDTTTISVDFSAGVNYSVTLAGNRTLGAPSNVKAGQTGAIRVAQDGTGSRTLSYNAVFKWAGGAACTLSTAASKVDYLFYFAYSSSEIMLSCAKDVR